MKVYVIILLFNFFCFYGVSQEITLGIHQNYIPVISQKADTLTSSISSGNQWFKNGVEIEGGNKQDLIITQSGNYMVLVTYPNSGCNSSSETFYATKTSVPNLQTEIITCKIFPNPNNGLFKIEIESEQSGQLILKLITLNGQTVVKEKMAHLSGIQTIQFGKAGLTKGTYLLQIMLGLKSISQKLIIE
ncbi:MAG: T9SS type A sorting domain-containing protein [Bacteroidota bacterium]|nr:T9SS type A sorting domain-containing protein [Bacteroidota bacterium]